jgi:hypothetical protein
MNAVCARCQRFRPRCKPCIRKADLSQIAIPLCEECRLEIKGAYRLAKESKSGKDKET